MRTREEIEKEYKDLPINEYHVQELVLEILLDQRDLLMNIEIIQSEVILNSFLTKENK